MARIHVVAGLIVDAKQQVLIACRPPNRAYSGYWEFPGGKLESQETPFEGLQRELHEEIGIWTLRAEPFVQLEHDYPERSILLDVWHVLEFEGQPFGREQQEVKWVPLTTLQNYAFPSANQRVIDQMLAYMELSTEMAVSRT